MDLMRSMVGGLAAVEFSLLISHCCRVALARLHPAAHTSAALPAPATRRVLRRVLTSHSTPRLIAFGLIPQDHWYKPNWMDEPKAAASRSSSGRTLTSSPPTTCGLPARRRRRDLQQVPLVLLVYGIGDLDLWRGKEYSKFFCWGNAPVHSIGVALFACKDQIASPPLLLLSSAAPESLTFLAFLAPRSPSSLSPCVPSSPLVSLRPLLPP
ncbi:hypothetical protein B0H11DRAFT_2231382 [Mycena galericulata]|nr:hypothetical protein B0H11DRAFT_2231382 [Mycena galericulata]